MQGRAIFSKTAFFQCLDNGNGQVSCDYIAKLKCLEKIASTLVLSKSKDGDVNQFHFSGNKIQEGSFSSTPVERPSSGTTITMWGMFKNDEKNYGHSLLKTLALWDELQNLLKSFTLANPGISFSAKCAANGDVHFLSLENKNQDITALVKDIYNTSQLSVVKCVSRSVDQIKCYFSGVIGYGSFWQRPKAIFLNGTLLLNSVLHQKLKHIFKRQQSIPSALKSPGLFFVLKLNVSEDAIQIVKTDSGVLLNIVNRPVISHILRSIVSEFSKTLHGNNENLKPSLDKDCSTKGKTNKSCSPTKVSPAIASSQTKRHDKFVTVFPVPKHLRHRKRHCQKSNHRQVKELGDSSKCLKVQKRKSLRPRLTQVKVKEYTKHKEINLDRFSKNNVKSLHRHVHKTSPVCIKISRARDKPRPVTVLEKLPKSINTSPSFTAIFRKALRRRPKVGETEKCVGPMTELRGFRRGDNDHVFPDYNYDREHSVFGENVLSGLPLSPQHNALQTEQNYVKETDHSFIAQTDNQPCPTQIQCRPTVIQHNWAMLDALKESTYDIGPSTCIKTSQHLIPTLDLPERIQLNCVMEHNDRPMPQIGVMPIKDYYDRLVREDTLGYLEGLVLGQFAEQNHNNRYVDASNYLRFEPTDSRDFGEQDPFLFLDAVSESNGRPLDGYLWESNPKNEILYEPAHCYDFWKQNMVPTVDAASESNHTEGYLRKSNYKNEIRSNSTSSRDRWEQNHIRIVEQGLSQVKESHDRPMVDCIREADRNNTEGSLDKSADCCIERENHRPMPITEHKLGEVDCIRESNLDNTERSLDKPVDSCCPGEEDYRPMPFVESLNEPDYEINALKLKEVNNKSTDAVHVGESNVIHLMREITAKSESSHVNLIKDNPVQALALVDIGNQTEPYSPDEAHVEETELFDAALAEKPTQESADKKSQADAFEPIVAAETIGHNINADSDNTSDINGALSDRYVTVKVQGRQICFDTLTGFERIGNCQDKPHDAEWLSSDLVRSVCSLPFRRISTNRQSSNFTTTSPKTIQEVDNILNCWQNPVMPVPHSVFEEIPALNADFAPFLTKVPVRIDKASFAQARIVGQIDNKFICCVLRGSTGDSEKLESEALILVDQHAADERVRLETLTQEYTCSSLEHDYNNAIPILKSQTLRGPIRLENFTLDPAISVSDVFQRLEKLGLQLNLSAVSNEIFVRTVPACMYKVETGRVNMGLIRDLIEEQMSIVRNQNKSTQDIDPNPQNQYLSIAPYGSKVVHETLCSLACHSAIRFGDALKMSECETLLKRLSTCSLPFQCAHGRPTIHPLIMLN